MTKVYLTKKVRHTSTWTECYVRPARLADCVPFLGWSSVLARISHLSCCISTPSEGTLRLDTHVTAEEDLVAQMTDHILVLVHICHLSCYISTPSEGRLQLENRSLAAGETPVA